LYGETAIWRRLLIPSAGIACFTSVLLPTSILL
jgi:hypothetical protein